MAEKIRIDIDEKESLSALLGKPSGELTPAQEKKLFVMMHGFPGHMKGHNDLYGDIEALLNEKGHQTLRFDFRGCGESDGKEEQFSIGRACEDFQYVMYWAKDQGFETFMYIGEGIGATVAMMNIDLNVKALALFWPVLDPPAFGSHAYSSDKMDGPILHNKYYEQDGHRIGIDYIQELQRTDILYAIKQTFIPVLCMHGARDEIIPAEQLDPARKLVPSKRIEITVFHDGGHGLPQLNHRKSMFYHLGQFIEKFS